MEVWRCGCVEMRRCGEVCEVVDLHQARARQWPWSQLVRVRLDSLGALSVRGFVLLFVHLHRLQAPHRVVHKNARDEQESHVAREPRFSELEVRGEANPHVSFCAVRPSNLVDAEAPSAYTCHAALQNGIFNSRTTSRANVGAFMAALACDADVWEQWREAMPHIRDAPQAADK